MRSGAHEGKYDLFSKSDGREIYSTRVIKTEPLKVLLLSR